MKISDLQQPTMTLWHGGNLDDNLATKSQKSGRYEYGSGLYATTHYGTAIKYAKGSRKLYQIVLEKGNDANTTMLSMQSVENFISAYVSKKSQPHILSSLKKYVSEDHVPAYIFNNVLLNNNAIPPKYTQKLSEFLVREGVDYLLVPNAFGWHEMMVVIFNLKKIKSIKRIMPKDKIDQFDLDIDFK